MSKYEEQLARLKELGPRYPGTQPHLDLIEDVAGELHDLGYEAKRDTHTFERWDVKPEGTSLRVAGSEVPISSLWPYSGKTDSTGLTGSLFMLDQRNKDWKAAKGKIAVFVATHFECPADLLFESWNEDKSLPIEYLDNPIVAVELAMSDLVEAREAGVLGVVGLWRGLSAVDAKNQYLPFIKDYQGIPAVWVDETNSAQVIEAAQRGEEATLILDAELTPGVTMDTLWTISPGTGPLAKEAVLVTTHSDGGNVLEENGHLGLLALARDAANEPHDRTIIFAYIAGHLRIPAVTKTGQATTAWLTAHPDLWSDEAKGGYTAVAGLVIEHLGAKHLVPNATTGEYEADATLEPELLYATSDEMARLTREMWKGVRLEGQTAVKPGALIHFGEGEPLFQHNIPAVALVTLPSYLLVETEADMIDMDLLARQIDSFRRLQEHLASNVDRASFGVVKSPTPGEKMAAMQRVQQFLAKLE